MADIKANLKVKTSTGYDKLNLSSIAELTSYINNESSSITNVKLALDYLFTNGILRKDVVDNLLSTLTTAPLSANQGRILNDKVTSINSALPWTVTWNSSTATLTFTTRTVN